MSITEVLVAILVLGIFGAAATQLVIEATAVTVNNASRIQASALAQRELDFAAEIVSASVEGADSLLDPSRVVNPNVTPEVASGDPDFAFQVDGQRYRVERNARRQLLGSGSPCSNDTVVAVKQFALEVTVTVTWQGMGVATRPHVASKLFAPKRATAVGLANGESLLAVTISGAQPTVEPRSQIEVQVSGPGVAGAVERTDSMGCVLFVVKPPTTGGDYVVTILGNTGGQAYVNLSSEVTETKTEYSVQPQQVRTIRFENYDQAASVTANVTLGGGGTADSVTLTPLGGTAGPVTATVVGGVANFDAVYPTTYSVETQPTPCLPNSITVAPGENQTIDVVIP